MKEKEVLQIIDWKGMNIFKRLKIALKIIFNRHTEIRFHNENFAVLKKVKKDIDIIVLPTADMKDLASFKRNLKELIKKNEPIITNGDIRLYKIIKGERFEVVNILKKTENK